MRHCVRALLCLSLTLTPAASQAQNFKERCARLLSSFASFFAAKIRPRELRVYIKPASLNRHRGDRVRLTDAWLDREAFVRGEDLFVQNEYVFTRAKMTSLMNQGRLGIEGLLIAVDSNGIVVLKDNGQLARIKTYSSSRYIGVYALLVLEREVLQLPGRDESS
ncbi:MAG: hypothetical protein KF799_07000 [Bdellovibrionales bacterium]|nr:hypothetical protein [Bdellovibrionales bacterium]